MTYTYLSTFIIFALTYIALVCDNLPKIEIDRTMIAFIGATAILVFTPFNIADAAKVIEFPILCLLFGMMVIVAYLDISGFFKLAMNWVDRVCHDPTSLLAFTVFISGFLSAFLINDIVCLALTPLMINLCHRRHLPQLPYLLAIGTAANIGSVATLTGNPQNMLIGHFSNISYLHFSLHTAPIAVICLVVDFFMIRYFFRRRLQHARQQITENVETLTIERPYFLAKTTVIIFLVIILFFTKIPLAITALGAAAFLSIDGTSPKRVYSQIDWPLLLLFISLFIIIGAFQQNVLSHWDISKWQFLQEHPFHFIAVASIVLSNTVSNVPAVLLFKPIIVNLAHPKAAGIFLAVSSTLAGNLTLLGSLANLIVVTVARKHGVRVTFMQFLLLGIPLTLVTMSIAYLIMLLY